MVENNSYTQQDETVIQEPPPVSIQARAKSFRHLDLSLGPWDDTSPHPWRRLIARFFDIIVVGTVSGIVFFRLMAVLMPKFFDTLIMLLLTPAGVFATFTITAFLSIPLMALCIGYLGTTPGKWLCGIKVFNNQNEPLGFEKAFKRELIIFTEGMWCVVPFVCLLPMGFAYRKLRTDGCTPWDESLSLKVLQRSSTPGQVLLITCMICMFVLLIFAF